MFGERPEWIARLVNVRRLVFMTFNDENPGSRQRAIMRGECAVRFFAPDGSTHFCKFLMLTENYVPHDHVDYVDGTGDLRDRRNYIFEGKQGRLNGVEVQTV